MFERGGEDVAEEVARLMATLVGDNLGIEHQREAVVVACGVAVGDHPADGPEVADLAIPDVIGHFDEERKRLAERRIALDVDVAHERTDLDESVVAAHLLQSRDPLDVDECRRLAEPEAHERDEALATGDELRVSAVLCQQ